MLLPVMVRLHAREVCPSVGHAYVNSTRKPLADTEVELDRIRATRDVTVRAFRFRAEDDWLVGGGVLRLRRLQLKVGIIGNVRRVPSAGRVHAGRP